MLLEIMWNKVEYALKYSQKAAGQSEEWYDSNGMKIVLNGRTFKHHHWGGRFHMLPQSYKTSHSLCLNNFLQVWLKCDQRDQVPLFRYIYQDDEVSNFVRGRKFLGDIKYLTRSV